MIFSSNVNNFRKIASNALRIATIAVFASSSLMSQCANAGLIEAAKGAASQSAATPQRAVVNTDRASVGDTATNQVQAVSLLARNTGSLVNVSAEQRIKPVDLSTVRESKNLNVTISEFTMALINAHALARLTILSDEDIDQASHSCGEQDAISRSFEDGLLSCMFKNSTGDATNIDRVFHHGDNTVFLNLPLMTMSDANYARSQKATSGFITSFVTDRQTTGKASYPTIASGEANDQDDSDNEDSDGNSSDEKPLKELEEDDVRQSLFMNADSFDPLRASVALFILGGIALVVNFVPRRSALTTQL